ncbi:unnamed protein product [Danaus chrysippus]|uniref:(African queen) hypothetical protein n=1 Tax=Danaus chrysippus TaxID=151541 RepID=A0A8J2W1M9_9NEOP|nr:unnamed protein product [Danaus chrysippus]
MCKCRKREEGPKKKKLTWCQRCRRRICVWCYRRIKRCVKRQVFGKSSPKINEYEIAGYTLSEIKDKFKRKSPASTTKSAETKLEPKPTVLTLFRKKIYNKSTKSLPMKDLIENEIDKYSFSKSVGKRMMSYLDDFRENNLYLGVGSDSQLNLTEGERARFKKLSDEYEKKNKKSFIDFLKNIEMLKKKHSLSLSKIVVLKNMADDYKNKKMSFTNAIPSWKNSKSSLNLNKLEKQDIDNLITYYNKQKKRRSKVSEGKISLKNLELMNVIDNEGMKKKFSLTNSRQILLTDMIEDYKKGKFKLSDMPDNLKSDMKKLDKQNLNKILDYYNKNKNNKGYPFIKQSRVKQMISDLRAKFDFK